MKKCPNCGSLNVRKSRHRHGKSSALGFISAWFRCRDCSSRFLRTDWSLLATWSGLAAGLFVLVWVSPWSGPRSPTEALVPAERPASAPPGLPLSEFFGDGRFSLPGSGVREAAESGDHAAQYALALELLQAHRERGDREALDEGMSWLRTAAEEGHVRAQLALGALYEQGHGVIQDYVEAGEWYRRAAGQGDAEAMLRLGHMTEAGKGVDKDPVAAYVWMNLAAARGESRAESSRDRVRSLLSTAEIAEAQERSRRLDREVPRDESP